MDYRRWLCVSTETETARPLSAYLMFNSKITAHAKSHDRTVAVVEVFWINNEGVDDDTEALRTQLEADGFSVFVFEDKDEANAESVLERARLGV